MFMWFLSHCFEVGMFDEKVFDISYVFFWSLRLRLYVDSANFLNFICPFEFKLIFDVKSLPKIKSKLCTEFGDFSLF